jgi:hypothetical protein
MRSTRVRAALALVLAAFTAACGDSGSTGPSFADSVSTEDAENFAGDATEGATFAMGALNFSDPGIGLAALQAGAQRLAARSPLAATRSGSARSTAGITRFDLMSLIQRPAGLQAVADEGCTYTLRGISNGGSGFVDVNQNGIPDDVYMKIICVTTDSSGGPGNRMVTTVSQEQSVKENFSSLHGYSGSYTFSLRWDYEGGDAEWVGESGEVDIDVRSGAASGSQEFRVREGYREGDDTYEWTAAWEDDASFDPDGTIALGSDLPDGDLTLGSRYAVTGPEGNNISFTISTSTPLAYNAACAAVPTNPPFTAGVLRGELNGSSNLASFEVTFTSCGNVSIDVDGAYDEVTITTAGR